MYAVHDSPEHSPTDIWRALADPTRRLLLDRLAQAPMSTSALCVGIPMTRFGVMKHIAVLERAGLIVARRHGRVRLNHINAAPLGELQSRWLSPRAGMLVKMGQTLESIAKEEAMSASSPAATIAHAVLEWEVPISVQRLWTVLFQEVDSWWPHGHRAVEASTMRFEERLGGFLTETAADGSGVNWYTVFALSPRRSVDLVGNLATRYGGPATSLLHIEILPGAADGSAILKLTDSVQGALGEGMRSSLQEGWSAIIGAGLVRHAEGSGP